jgi:hypothetical protein
MVHPILYHGFRSFLQKTFASVPGSLAWKRFAAGAEFSGIGSSPAFPVHLPTKVIFSVLFNIMTLYDSLVISMIFRLYQYIKVIL